MWPSISTHGYISGKNKNTNSEQYRHPRVCSSTIYSSQADQVLANRCDYIDKTWWNVIRLEEDMVCTMEYHLAIKKNAIFSNMNEPREYYTWWNKSERERQIL